MTINVKPCLDIVMSDAALNRLPPVFREIVLHQRDLETLCSAALVDFRIATNMLDRRAFLARNADKVWNHQPLRFEPA